MDNSKITDALAKLDPANENHWTQDGLPRLETVRILTSNPALTRQDIQAASPDFVRPAAPLQAPAAPTPGNATDPHAPTAPAAAGAGLVAAPLVQATEDLETLEAALAEAKLNYEESSRAAADAKRSAEEFQNEMDAIATKIALLNKASGRNPHMDYMARQQQELAQRAERQKAIRESGVDLRAITAGLVAPIDQALSGRRRSPRG